MIVTPLQDLTQSKSYSIPTKVLEAGKHYFVYAIGTKGSNKEYYIMEDELSFYPRAFNAKLFLTVDESIPVQWVTVRRRKWLAKTTFSSFPEWANDLGSSDTLGFYERLVDSGPHDKARDTYVGFVRVAYEALRTQRRKDVDDMLKDYSRLVRYGEDDAFLDVDTTLIMHYRNELEENIDLLTGDEFKQLTETDAIFKHKAVVSFKAYTRKIRRKVDGADYLEAILIDLRHYSKSQPHDKWWFHILPKDEQ